MKNLDLNTVIIDLKSATGLSTDDFLSLLNLKSERWNEILNGTSSFNLNEINYISFVFQVKIDYLLKGIVDLNSISKKFHNSSFSIDEIRSIGSRNLCYLNLINRVTTEKIEALSAN